MSPLLWTVSSTRGVFEEAAPDGEAGVRLPTVELSEIRHRMGDADTEPPAPTEDPCDLGDGGRHVRHDLQ